MGGVTAKDKLRIKMLEAKLRKAGETPCSLAATRKRLASQRPYVDYSRLSIKEALKQS